MGLFGAKEVKAETGVIPDGVTPELVEENGVTFLVWGHWPFKKKLRIGGTAGSELQHMAEEGEYIDG